MKSIRRILTLILLGVHFLTFGQQDPLYSQYHFNQSVINPAYTGVNDAFNATAIARRQWTGVGGAPETNIINVSSSLLLNKLGAGILVMSDKYGVNRNNEFQGMISYKIDLLNGKVFSFGLQSGYTNYRYDYQDIKEENVGGDDVLNMQNENVSQVNFGAGIFLKTPNFFFGFSVPKMLNTVDNFNQTIHRRHYYFITGYVFDQLIALKFKPSVLLKVVEGQPVSVDLNASLLLAESIWVGLSLRNFNAVGLNGQFEIIDQLRLGYSFELPLNNVSNFGTTSFGTHELMVSFDLELFDHHAIGRRYF